MYNQNRSRKLNSKKILHKIKRRWVVISLAILSTLGFGTTEVHGHADANNDQINHQNQATTQSTGQPKAKLIQQNRSTRLLNANNSTNKNEESIQKTSATLPENSGNHGSIQQRANALHQQILLNGIKAVSHHHASANVAANQNLNNKTLNKSNQFNLKASNQNVTGQWGTAPFQFDPTSGRLQTTGRGIIAPVNKLSRVPFSDVKSIQFAPGTQAPSDSTGLFQASDIEIPTTDGHYGSDSIAYVSALRNLKQIDLTNLDTSQVTSMAKMFGNDSGLQQIIFGPKFNTAKVNEMAEMFQSDNDLKSLDLSSFDTSNVLDTSSMFKSDYELSNLNLGNHFNTHYVNYMSDMFQSDNDLKALNLGTQFYLNYPQNLSNMFMDDYALTRLNLGDHFNTQTVGNMSDMFANDSDLDSLDLGPLFYTAQVSDMHDLFKDDANLKTIALGSHFDTTKASTKQYATSNQVNSNSYNGAPGAYESYAGSKGIFEGDQSLDRIQMNHAKLVGPVDLSVPTLTAWYLSSHDQAEGLPVNLNDGNLHSGTYQLSSTDPVITTDLNFQDVNHNHQSIGDILINGLKGTNIPFATISNALGDGYVSAIPISDLMKTFPNVPYQYRLGVVNIPVKKVSNESTNGNNSLVTPDSKSESNAVNSYMASLADQKIANYYQSSVTNSVSIANQQKAKSAATSADQSIDDSIANSATKSADLSIENSIARSAAHSTDAQIEQSIANSYATSADWRIESSESASVINSVSVANQQYAKMNAKLANQSLESSIASSAASSADRYLDDSIANSYAKSTDQQIKALERASVVNSVSVANQRIAENDANSADQRIERYYQNSISNSVSVKNQSLANRVASSNDRQIENSIAQSYTNQTDKSIAQSYQDSVSASVSVKNQSLADSTANSADQEIKNSIAQSYAYRADQRIEQSYQNSVSASVSIKDRSLAHRIANSVDSKMENLKRTSSANSISVQDQQIKSSEYNPFNSELNTRTFNSVITPVNLISQSSISSANSNLSGLNENITSSVSSANAIRQDNNDHNAPVNALKIGQNLRIGNRIVSRAPVKYREIRINRTCLAHDHITSVGKAKDYSGNLKKGTVVKIEKTFRVKVNHHIFNRYEIILGHHHYFITANSLYATSASIQPGELRHHHVYGTKAHRYYHVIIEKPCFVYKNGHHEQRLLRGSLVHVKGIIYTGRKGHRVEHLILTNGQLITANKDYVKIR